ncbi:MAG: hypothetical protein HKN30_15030 [Sulfitobacter sp.]|nr:hypothetical protein [Sulfitobacter sp.]
MAYIKEIATGVGALACAIGIGFVMQNSEAADKRYGAEAPLLQPAEPVEMESIEAVNAANAMLDVQQIKLTSAEYDSAIAIPATDAEIIKTSAPPAMPDAPDAPAVDMGSVNPDPKCKITANARAMAAAMVELSLSAACLPNERVTIHHNGMIFTETTSGAGMLSMRVPALAEEAVFIMAFTDGQGAVAQTTVEDLGDFQRAVLQWKGNTGFQIHVREFGANYGDAGHLWEGAPGTIAAAVIGESGVLTRHGDPSAPEPLLAEVYTFPMDANVRNGDIALSVEAEVTQTNCGIEIEAQSLELKADGAVKTRNLTLPVPECDAKGSFLVLNNLLQDLKVASR